MKTKENMKKDFGATELDLVKGGESEQKVMIALFGVGTPKSLGNKIISKKVLNLEIKILKQKMEN